MVVEKTARVVHDATEQVIEEICLSLMLILRPKLSRRTLVGGLHVLGDSEFSLDTVWFVALEPESWEKIQGDRDRMRLEKMGGVAS